MDLESLFSENGDWQTNACLNFQPDMSHGYIYGYKKAADSLVMKISKDRAEIDYLIYPIVFLYRHHIELQLKKLLELNIKLHEREGKVPNNHKIKNLWPQVKGYYRKLNNSSNQEEIKFIDRIMDELCIIDPESMNFRYSKMKDGELPNKDLKHINIEVFSSVVGRVSDALETFEYQLNAEIDSKSEYMSSWL
ncbi:MULTISPECIES: hypothetical protein [unclassified Halomonas]|uniref:hypothetical protein n=1 Tax=unclassified Halomonas TaxID=2609666 RepID=UPI0007D9FC6F|nr:MULTISPECIES: hypothetical protein [unclassified Halomonas]MBT2785699.1 hypothetical protein [Halomonas sp. ISL-106]MBT2798753.1 hypothetical protein [Halomonas sp. ISL-104]OAL59122.1 hypothetical protein A6R74_04830 [Halomonas sp. ALS9]